MDLSAEVQQIKGIGPKTAAILQKAGLYTVRDLLYYLPRDYENYQTAVKIKDLTPGKVMVRGRISQLKVNYTRRRNFTITEGIITDDTGSLKVVWYNQTYRQHAYDPGQEYYFTGTYDLKYNRYQLLNPSSTAAAEVDSTGPTSDLQPIYRARGKLQSPAFKKLFRTLRPVMARVPDLLPPEHAPDFITQSSRADALLGVHFPATTDEVARSREYLSYEELFELILAARLNQQETARLQAFSLPFSAAKTQAFTKQLPFKLTDAQRVAAWDILQDLEKPTPMNRLLQGDVGSGKTVVAALAAHQTAQNGHQTAILAPTAILATQHAETLQRLLRPLKVALLTGATKHKEALKAQIRSGAVDVIVGTHALLTDDTTFHSPALCVIDEQHRFGVEQRQKLLAKTALTTPGKSPHFLAMTATPIPRSLQLTIFGDLDVSVISSLPKGRQPIQTTILPEVQLQPELYPKLRQHLTAGEQVYWICKQIGDGPGASDNRAVVAQARHLQQIFPKFTVAYLHGRLKPAEKDEIMARFAAGQIQLLVSTTVVEVGVDVPNATQIVIQDAENYGLAQLHQLRGRVGRGTKPSHCYLLTSGDNQPSLRLQELEKSTDGFHLAEVDLNLRGPGEIYGNLQHGALDLRIASLSDTKLIAAARKQALAFAKTPQNMVKYPELAASIQKYQQLTTLN